MAAGCERRLCAGTDGCWLLSALKRRSYCEDGFLDLAFQFDAAGVMIRDDTLDVVWEEMQNCNMTPGLGLKAESGRDSTKRLTQSKHKPKANFKFSCCPVKQIIQETLRSQPLYHFKSIVCVWSLSPLLLFK